MNEEDKKQTSGQGPEANVPEGIPTGANSAAKPGSGNKPDREKALEIDVRKMVTENEKLTKENKSLLFANDRLVDERDKFAKQVIELGKKVEDQKTVLKGKETQITNLKKKVKKGSVRKMRLTQH